MTITKSRKFTSNGGLHGDTLPEHPSSTVVLVGFVLLNL